ncbi:Quinol monooxygenase YgiN [Parasphingorhabdus marina DSM 22363]|uniref:Quinol monooxygenase YgiN n=2 Tax=Parasphingorhabdus marina TaxID=394732 RepID=A0A1N6ETR9_9SPHN|nr:Quinol monooxygenase YgiN [Parasphingorhabdus marina DSM 22363]
MLAWMGVVALPGCMTIREERWMEEVLPYGIIGQMKVAAGQRETLIAILAEGTRNMPGNISYTISKDQSDENALWITEYWESKDAHAASLQLESVQAAIGKGRALIEGFGHRFEVTPVAGG